MTWAKIQRKLVATLQLLIGNENIEKFKKKKKRKRKLKEKLPERGKNLIRERERKYWAIKDSLKTMLKVQLWVFFLYSYAEQVWTEPVMQHFLKTNFGSTKKQCKFIKIIKLVILLHWVDIRSYLKPIYIKVTVLEPVLGTCEYWASLRYLGLFCLWE